MAEPWTDPGFVDAIVALQRQREARTTGDLVFFDRSPVCALALARFLGHPVSDLLSAELARIAAEDVYERRVFLVRGLGFITPTAARRIGLEDAMAFERVHEETYREQGYALVSIAPASPADRATMVLNAL